jgi:hypothetical protein
MIIDPKRPHGVDTIKMIEGDDRVREEKCLQEIRRICQQYDCLMRPELVISGNNIQTRVAIVAQPRIAPQGGSQN